MIRVQYTIRVYFLIPVISKFSIEQSKLIVEELKENFQELFSASRDSIQVDASFERVSYKIIYMTKYRAEGNIVARGEAG